MRYQGIWGWIRRLRFVRQGRIVRGTSDAASGTVRDSITGPTCLRACLFFALFSSFPLGPATAQETDSEVEYTVEYIYDARGNMIEMIVAGSPHDSAPDTTPSLFSVGDISAYTGQMLTFTITRTGRTDREQTVRYITSEGATSLTGYVGYVGTVTFAAGVTEMIVTIPATRADDTGENIEIYFNLYEPTQGAGIDRSRGIARLEARPRLLVIAISPPFIIIPLEN